MTDSSVQLKRLAILTELVNRAPAGFGRTALMKCVFFLQVLKDVPLPYTFRLYTYGPFDADVLDDLRYAEFLGAIESTVVRYPGGYGYEFHAGPQAGKIVKSESGFVAQHLDSIDWILREFGRRSASDLEMASTLVYIDRNLAEKGATATIAEIARKVHDVKPHLTTEAIEREAQSLKDRGLLTAVE